MLKHKDPADLSLFESSPLPSWIFEKKTFKVVQANKAAVKTLGYTRQSWKKLSLTDFILLPSASRKLNKKFKATAIHKSGKRISINVYVSDVTLARKKYLQLVIHETAEKTAEKKYNTILPSIEKILDIITDGFFAVDRNWNIVLANGVMAGYKEKSLLGKNLWEMFPHLYGSASYDRIHYAMNTGHAQHFEHFGIVEKGNVYEVHAYPSADTLLITFRNITTRKKAEEENKKLALIASHTSNAVILTDKEGRITWVNDGFERTTGYTHAEALGKKPGDLLQGPDTDQEVVRAMREGLQHGQGFKVEVLNYTKSGKPYWVDVEVIPMRNEQNEITCYIAIELDITLLKTAVSEMLKSQEQLQTIVNNLPMDVYMKDLQGRYIFYNRTFESHFDGSKKLTSITDYDLFEKHVADNFRESDRAVIQTRETLRVEQDINHRGNVDTYYTIKFPIYDNNKHIYAIGGASLQITDRKKMEMALRESEERIRMAQEAAFIGTWDWDIPNNIVYWHGATPQEKSFERHPYGSYEEFLNIIHPEDRGNVHSYVQEALNGKDRYYAEFRVNWPGGKQGWLLGSGSVFRKQKGEPARMVGIYMDITARKEAEENVKKNHQLLQETTSRLLLATGAAHIGVWEWNIQTGESLWNNTMYDIFGITPEQHANSVQNWLNCTHPEDINALKETLHYAIQGSGDYHFDYRIKHPDGSVRHITNYAMVQRGQNGEATKMIGVNWDVTNQKQFEIELRQSEARYRSIVDNQIEIICRYKRDGSLTFVNRAYLYSIDQDKILQGKGYFDFIHEEEREKVRHYIDQVFDGKTTPSPAERRTFMNGEWKWHEWFDMPLKDEQGHVYEIQSIGHDISQRKELEAEQARLDKIVRESYNEIYLFNYHNLQFEFANSSALKNLGYSAEEFNKLRFPDLFTYPDEMALQALLNPLRRQETDRLQLQLKHLRKDSSHYDVDVLIQVLEKDQSFVAIVSDITAKLITEKKLMDTIREKETLIKEIHHRVKNNLQLISSILYLKMSTLGHSDIRTFLENTRQKIRSIALIHERLLQTEKLDKVEISDYLGKLIHDLRITYGRPDLILEVKSIIHQKIMGLDTAIICGLIVNELVTNAIKHAFTGRATGLIEISFEYDETDRKHLLKIADDGVSLPAHITPGYVKSFGMQLLDVFVKQLGGTFEIIREKGTIFQIRF